MIINAFDKATTALINIYKNKSFHLKNLHHKFRKHTIINYQIRLRIQSDSKLINWFFTR